LLSNGHNRFVICNNGVSGKLRDATIEELLGEVFSVQSLLRCYDQDKCRFYLVVRQSQARKDVDMEAVEAMALETVTM
jgi:hypothetical protein